MDEYESLLEGTSVEKMRNLRQSFVGDISIVQKELHAIMGTIKEHIYEYPEKEKDVDALGLLQEEDFIKTEVANKTDQVKPELFLTPAPPPSQP